MVVLDLGAVMRFKIIVFMFFTNVCVEAGERDIVSRMPKKCGLHY